MRPRILCGLTLLAVVSNVLAQRPFTDPANLSGERITPRDGRELPVDQGVQGLQQMLRRLNTRGSILNLVAHPDDEDGGMLTLYSRGLGARVADLSLTRGEGGQNAMTGDFEDALGLLRTQELLASDRYAGIGQFFGTEVDFGFSKTKEESFAKWTHERVLYDAVRAIRIYRPLVITATFLGGVTDGHGQHQVSGQIAQEAFVAAGDPKVFPEMIAEGILPWQPLKVYARVPMQAITPQGLFDYATGQYTPARFTNYVTGEVTSSEPSVDVVVHEGTPDPLLDGKSYVQFARLGLGQQKSQIGPGVRNASAGAFDVSYHRYGSRVAADKQKPHEDSFFDGIDTSILGIADLAPDAFPTDMLSNVARGIKAATEQFDPAHPEKIAPALAASLKVLDELIPEVEDGKGDAAGKVNALHELHVKRVQLNDALTLALGLTLEATTSSSHDGDSVLFSPLKVETRLTSSKPIEGGRIYLQNGQGGWTNEHSDSPAPFVFTTPLPVTESLDYADVNYSEIQHGPRAAVTRPYFHRDSIEQPFYDLTDPRLRNAPATPNALSAWADVRYEGVGLRLGHVVLDGMQPVRFVPKLNVALSSHAQVLPRPGLTFTVSATNHSLIDYPTYLGLCAADTCFDPDKTATPDPQHATFTATLPTAPPPSGVTVMGALVIDKGTNRDLQSELEGYRPVGYGDLPRTNYYVPAVDRIVPVDLKLPSRRRIGYLPGTGDDVPEALRSIGLKPEILTVADLTAGKLKGFDTVVLGVRTYGAHPELHGAPTEALLAYAREGGNVVVQYQTAEFGAEDAPYPLALGRDAEKVVDETDPVRLLDSGAALLSTPNKIAAEDFKGWIEERGHGFVRTWDPRYAALTETHDPGQDPQKGGIVTTQLGKGRWTYCAFAIYRQLPEAVPGAYRLFVNLLTPP